MLKKQTVVERASLLNSSDQGSLVLAASRPDLSGKERVVAYACKDCSTHFATNRGSQPYCVNCGSEEVEQMPQAQAPDVPESDDELLAVQCRNESCSTFNIIHTQTAKVLDGVMHCVTCGSVLAYDNDFNDGGDAPADTRPAEGKPGTPADTRPAEGKPGTPADTRPPAGDPIVQQHAGAEDDEDEDGWGAEREQSSKRPWRQQADAPGDQQMQEDDIGSPDDDDVTLVQPLDNDPDSQGLGEQADADPEDPDADEVDPTEPVAETDMQEQDACDNVMMSMASLVLASKPKAELSLIGSPDTIYAMLDDVHVATLKKEHAGENADILTSRSFMAAISEMAAKEGVVASMKNFGFKPVKFSFPQTRVTSALVAKRVQAGVEKWAERASEVQDDMEQCVQLAASGLNRGFFTGRENSLRKGFIQALTTAGVKNAERIVAGVFQRYADDYHRVLFSVASDLMKKPVEIRNELASTLKQVDASVVTASEQDEADLGSRAEASVRAVPQETKPEVAHVHTNVASITNLRQRAGGRLF